MKTKPAHRRRVEAFKQCLLNTCVRILRPSFSEGLSLSNCMGSDDFMTEAYTLLQLPFFSSPVEGSMEAARTELMRDMEFADLRPAR